MLPSWGVPLGGEDSHDGNALDWAFHQEGRVRIDRENKVIKNDMSDNNGHVRNQSGCLNHIKKLWYLLLDNKSTRDVIIN